MPRIALNATHGKYSYSQTAIELLLDCSWIVLDIAIEKAQMLHLDAIADHVTALRLFYDPLARIDCT